MDYITTFDSYYNEPHKTTSYYERRIEEIAIKNFGKDFKFRPHQKETIIDILRTFFDGEENLYLLDAPTGSGKSIIALLMSEFINEHKLRGYILASELSLVDQYVNDIEKYFRHFGSIKGMDNYWCTVNSERFGLGDCRMKNLSYEEAENLACYPSCGYFQDRRRAIKAPTSLMTYSYWLIQRNYVEGKMAEKGKSVPFPKRDFTICDEAHKISDIVQNHFSPKIDDSTNEKLEKLRSSLIKHNLRSPSCTSLSVQRTLGNLFNDDSRNKLYASSKEFELQLLDFVHASDSIKEHVARNYPGDIKVPKEWRFLLGLADWAKDMHCKFEDYNHILSQTGIQSMVKNPQDGQTIFNCLDESYMMNKHFHSQAGFKLLMTATMGDPTSFLKTIGSSKARYYRMESSFDFAKSPIYYFPGHRMSMSNKEKSLPWVIEKVNDILDTHPDENGIIHSGSYELTSRIFNGLSEENKKRVHVYKGTQEKEEVLEKFKKEKNSVVMGPSILEGLDLAQERSRFQIFVKVPFPSLGDKLVSARMEYQPERYDWRAIISILQGIGRSVRSEDDWAITYFLDGNLSDLLRRKRKSFPPEILKRIKLIQE